MTTTPDRRAPGPHREPVAAAAAAADVRLPQQHHGDPGHPGDPGASAAPGNLADGGDRAVDRAGGPGATRAPAAPTRPAAAPTRPAAAPTRPAAAPTRPAAAPAAPPLRDAPRWVRWTVLPLLVLVPLGYVLISAEQSRDGGATNQQEAAARHLTPEAPSALQQRIYQVPFPVGATNAGYLETNSWDTSVFYAQFTTTAGGLDTFLAKIGTSRDALHRGSPAVTAAQAAAVGWDLAGGGPWSGLALRRAGDRPDHAIAVDFADAEAPTVYVVSTVNFQHGFGGG